jgi:hypothetical protein
MSTSTILVKFTTFYLLFIIKGKDVDVVLQHCSVMVGATPWINSNIWGGGFGMMLVFCVLKKSKHNRVLFACYENLWRRRSLGGLRRLNGKISGVLLSRRQI